MHNRRAFMASLAVAPLFAVPAASAAGDKITANGIPGKPPMLDFGDGVKIPLDKHIFLTLWDDPRFWLTYGVGNSDFRMKAMGDAETSATATMKLLLLTLAFAPQRLERVYNCGWRLKSQNPKDYVIGDVPLPGHPFQPVISGASSNGRDNGMQYGDVMGNFNKIHAFTGYMVMKKDASLDYIRSRAQIL